MESPANGPASRRPPPFPRPNNLDALRLLFALQVFLSHLFAHFETGLDRVALSYGPGVPAFFFVSGLLIYAAYDRATSLGAYAANRALRLYPGLFVVALAGVAFAVLVKGDTVTPGQYLGFLVATVTLGQSLHPDWLRDVGVGVMNGPLWSIATELLFYASVPVLHALQARWRGTLWTLFALSFAIYWLGPRLLGAPLVGDKSAFDFLALTPVVWGWMFLAGSLCHVHFDRVARTLRHGWLALPVLAAVAWLGGDGAWLNARGQWLGVLYFLPFAWAILWAAFHLPALRLPADLSYGLYVWHMPVINALLVLGLRSVPLAIALSVVAAALSWYLVERPALAFKRDSIRRGPTGSRPLGHDGAPVPLAPTP